MIDILIFIITGEAYVKFIIKEYITILAILPD